MSPQRNVHVQIGPDDPAEGCVGCMVILISLIIIVVLIGVLLRAIGWAF